MATKKTVRKRVAEESRIVYVSYRANIEVSRFAHIHIEAGAEVGRYAEPDHVVQELKRFVDAELVIAKDAALFAKRESMCDFQHDGFLEIHQKTVKCPVPFAKK